MRDLNMTAAQGHEIWSVTALVYVDDFPDCDILQRFDQLGAKERFAALADTWVMRARFVWAIVWAVLIPPSHDPALKKGKSLNLRGDFGSGGRDRTYDQLINSQMTVKYCSGTPSICCQ